MNYKNAIINIEKSSYDSIFSMEESELDSELSSLNIDVNKQLKALDAITTDAVLLSKKNKLKNARLQLDKQNEHQSKKSHIVDFLSKKQLDAKDFLISLLIQGKTTLAFRDGQELSNDEAIGIIDNLIELGEINIDE
ncbi:hypothetical protein FGD67_21250 [Colwellia sp. M166]|uniref:hypothetical protein n=1 Tax=Colwellia sp. M166 TaxID=2583805 RepID=UPI00211E80DF|nr:hypothetical protein [Colwellia sp. M166]UUO25459.1 hypothetical protein FGD67_21250 [Colwellia sp. M166]